MCGTWTLESSENFEEFLVAIGIIDERIIYLSNKIIFLYF